MRKLILTLSIVLLFMSCDDKPMETEVNPFVGTWEKTTENDIETFQFTDTAVKSIYKSIIPPISTVTVNGTYQYYDTVLIFRMESGFKFFTDYSISGNELTITYSHNGNTVIYIKKN